MNDKIAKFVIYGIIAKLRNVIQSQYRVRMKTLSDTYSDDYYESMVRVSELLDVVDELENAVKDDYAK